MYTGYQLCELVRKIIGESGDSNFLDKQLTYQLLNEAALKTAQRSQCLTGSQTITTVASQAAYSLEPDFLELYVKDSNGYPIVKLYNGSSYSFVLFKQYEDSFVRNNTEETSIPSNFYITLEDASSNVTGTTTSAGKTTAGSCTLTNSGASFTSTVKVGDSVYNTTDGSNGVVLSITSNTAIITALFNGTNNDWTSGDAYVIIPQSRYKLVFDPTCSTAGYTVEVPYVKKPTPVYSDYGSFNFPQNLSLATAYYAAWLYKYKDQEPNFGNAWYQFWVNELGVNRWQAKKSTQRNRIKVNLKRRS